MKFKGAIACHIRARAHDAIGPSNLARSDRLLLLHYNI